MNWHSDEIRLWWMLALNAAVLACAFRVAKRRGGGDSLQTAIDTLLIWFLVQYLSVGIVGCIGALSAASIGLTAIILCTALLAISRKNEVAPPTDQGWGACVACGVFILTYLASVLYVGQYLLFPVSVTDALTYHLPAAAAWLQNGRISLWPTWFFNPANTYSPLAGSIFIEWLLAPMGNDVAARFAQVPPLILLFLCLTKMAGGLGINKRAAPIVAAAAVMSRPFLNEAIISLTKDDLWLTAFFAAAVAALFQPRRENAVAPLRFGVALGLFLSTKYTALMAAPIFLLAIDAPKQSGWRRRDWLLAAVAVLLLAGPWYLRNAILTGNPIFPIHFAIFNGPLSVRRSDALASWSGTWNILSGTYNSLPAPIWGLLAAGWLAAIVVKRREIIRQPLVRLAILGPVVGIGLFVAFSPYGEVRFIFPAIVLLFAASAAGLPPRIAIGGGVILAIACVITDFMASLIGIIAQAAFLAAGITAVVLLIYYLFRWMRWPRPGLWTGAIFAVVLAIVAGAIWPRYLADYRDRIEDQWTYGPQVDLWRFIRAKTPDHATIAYANTSLTYPLMGFDLNRRVVYAPVQAGLSDMRDLPVLGQSVPGEKVAAVVIERINQNADRTVWLKNLESTRADYLLVVLATGDPPEARFAKEEPAKFAVVFANQAGVIYRILNR